MPKIHFSSSKRKSKEPIKENNEIFGTVFRQNNLCWVTPCDKDRRPYLLGAVKNLHNNDLVEIEPENGSITPKASLIKNYGQFSVGLLSEILIARRYKIPDIFSQDILKECKNFEDFDKVPRTDLTNLPFVTIDGDDSRDFDDAVYACRHNNGFSLIVAIADVAFYVRPDSKLDSEAYKRGNSVYLPQKVIPMLPEILSNNLCSLNPKVRRPVIACFMEIDRHGTLQSYRFERAVIKSAARLTYKEVEAAIGGHYSNTAKKVFSKAIQPLYEAYHALAENRLKRGALDIESDEIKIKFSTNGDIVGIEKQQNLTANKLIEEFMIAANVAAARFLSESKLPTMYRIHDKPPEEKLTAIKPLLASLKMKLPPYPALRPCHFNKILEICRKKNIAGIDNLILRLQCQAEYSPHNCGHFGLNLKQYVHFTSPIRRYADLLIHRAILNACNQQKEGVLSIKAMEQTAEHLCVTERTAAMAEREITSHYISLYLSPLTGVEFDLKISGLSNAGIFVRLEDIGAEGLIPMRTLPRDYYQLLDSDTCLRGVETKLKFRLGDKICAKLLEAAPISGGLIFSWLPDKNQFCSTSRKKQQPKKSSKKKRAKNGHA